MVVKSKHQKLKSIIKTMNIFGFQESQIGVKNHNTDRRQET